MSDFTRIWNSILDGSLHADFEARHVFEDLLKICDSNGVVDMTISVISARLGVPVELLQAKIYGVLEAEDPNSRSKACGGRRLIRLEDSDGSPRPWGWLIVNYDVYRAKKSDETYRAGARTRMKELRARRRACVQGVVSLPPPHVLRNDENNANNGEHSPPVTQPRSDVDVDVEQNREPSVAVEPLRISEPSTQFLGGPEVHPQGTGPDRVLVLFPLRGGRDYGLSEGLAEKFQPDFPQLDVRAEFVRMRAWALAQQVTGGKKLKTAMGVPAFVRNWLDGEAEKVRTGRRHASPPARAAPASPAVVAAGQDEITKHLTAGGSDGNQVGAESP